MRQQQQRADKRSSEDTLADEVAKSGAQKSAVWLLCAAAILHLAITVTFYSLGQSARFPAVFDSEGVAVAIAPDAAIFRADAAALSEALRGGAVRYWFSADYPFHVKLYSICFALFGPWLGFNVLGAEPLNAFFYLATLVLVFRIGREVFNWRSGLLAAVVVGLWPSFLFHTTQFLKDPAYVSAFLALILILARWLMRTYSWPAVLRMWAAGSLLATALWLTRSDMGVLLIAAILIGALLLVARRLREGASLTANLVGSALLLAVAVSIPLIMPDALELGASRMPAGARNIATEEAAVMVPPPAYIWSRAAARIGRVRRRFATMYSDSGSLIDADVQINDAGDLLSHLPRAAAVGFFAPFPNMWLATGKQVGSMGRRLAGLESLAMYAVEGLAIIGLWRGRRRLPVWLLLSVAATGMIALGLVVINVGALYRLRYVFLVFLIILAAEGAAQILDWLSKRSFRGGERGEAV